MPGNFVPIKGSTLLIPSGTAVNPAGQHLFIVLTNRCVQEQHLLVSISTVRANRPHDATCLIENGEHDFVQAQSYVLYAMPRQLPHIGIVKCVAGSLYFPKTDCSANLLQKICDGVSVSPMTPRWAKEYFRINCDR